MPQLWHWHSRLWFSVQVLHRTHTPHASLAVPPPPPPPLLSSPLCVPAAAAAAAVWLLVVRWYTLVVCGVGRTLLHRAWVCACAAEFQHFPRWTLWAKRACVDVFLRLWTQSVTVWHSLSASFFNKCLTCDLTALPPSVVCAGSKTLMLRPLSSQWKEPTTTGLCWRVWTFYWPLRVVACTQSAARVSCACRWPVTSAEK